MTTVFAKEVVEVACCPHCSREGKKHSESKREIKTMTGVLMVQYSKHYCAICEKYFVNPATRKYAPDRYSASWEFIRTAIELAKEATLRGACEAIGKRTGNSLKPNTLHEWIYKQDELFADMSS